MTAIDILKLFCDCLPTLQAWFVGSAINMLWHRFPRARFALPSSWLDTWETVCQSACSVIGANQKLRVCCMVSFCQIHVKKRIFHFQQPFNCSIRRATIGILILPRLPRILGFFFIHIANYLSAQNFNWWWRCETNTIPSDVIALTFKTTSIVCPDWLTQMCVHHTNLDVQCGTSNQVFLFVNGSSQQ